MFVSINLNQNIEEKKTRNKGKSHALLETLYYRLSINSKHSLKRMIHNLELISSAVGWIFDQILNLKVFFLALCSCSKEDQQDY